VSLRAARVLVTRALPDLGPLEELLAVRGATPVAFPCIELEELGDELPEAALRADFVAIASPHAARLLLRRAPGLFKTAQFAAAGRGTAAALGILGQPALVPASGVGADALAALLEPLVRGKVVLIPRAEGGNPALPERLAAAGAKVIAVSLYRTIPARVADPSGLSALRQGRIDAIAFGSGSAARGFVALLGPEAAALARRPKIVCMGKSCAAAARAAGLVVAEVSEGGFVELCDAVDRALAVGCLE